LIQLFGKVNEVQTGADINVGGASEGNDIIEGVRLIGIEGVPEGEPGFIRPRAASSKCERSGQENGSTDFCQFGPCWKM
jgi:hypothetical protein